MHDRFDCTRDDLIRLGAACTTVLATMKANELAKLVKQKIENLRPKLLDLSRRNPLIATKLGPRSNSRIRAVDELPDILFF
jgi:hypothetical protein